MYELGASFDPGVVGTLVPRGWRVGALLLGRVCNVGAVPRFEASDVEADVVARDEALDAVLEAVSRGRDAVDVVSVAADL